MKKLLIQAKQEASQAKGQNFYVTEQGLKRDFDLMGGEFIYKVYFKKGLYVKDSKNKDVETPRAKVKVSSKLRNTTISKTDKGSE